MTQVTLFAVLVSALAVLLLATWGSLRPHIRLGFGLAVLGSSTSMVSAVLNVVSGELSDQGTELVRFPSGGGLELGAQAIAVAEASVAITRISLAFVVVGLVVCVGGGWLTKRLGLDVQGGSGDVREALNAALEGLVAMEHRATMTSEELARLEADKERVRALASLSEGQLAAINATVAPGARTANRLAVAAIVIGVAVTALFTWWAEELLPWQ